MNNLSNKNIISNLHKILEIIGCYLGYYIAMLINYIDV
jgi:hypothetical protein